jgi:phospholipid/cholesterol/gamma-HCH transport system substrate-binding protein
VNTDSKVGAFVIGCLILLGVTVFYVGNEQWGRHLTPYRTYLRYAGGVAAGSEVLFGGIVVGKVTTVRAWTQDPTRIEILIEVKEGTPLNQKSVAKLGSVSLMSSPAISITTGANDAGRLLAGQAIPSQESVSIDDMLRKVDGLADGAGELMVQVKGELATISTRADAVLANLNEATGPANRRQISEILQEVNALVARQSPKLDQITDQVLLVSQDADSAIKKVGPLVERTDTTVANVNSTIDQLRDPIRQDLAQVDSTLAQVKILVASLQTVVQGNDDNIRETTENLRIATENLDQLTEQVKQKPWSLVRIRQPKDRKVPR